ncbi:fido domain-containing protein [Terfezia claveryi]|nr:fido domain-containing protein [Terfezia claveryi]
MATTHMSVVRTCTGTEGIYAHGQYVWSAGGPLDTWATNGNLPHGANHLILPDLNPGSCTSQAITAFENLVINHPNQPCLLARLAKVYVWLQHIYGANTLCSRILEIVGFTADPVFTKWAAIVSKHCASITAAEMQFYRNPGLPNVIYTTKLSRIESYTIEEPSAESAKVREQWIGLNSAMSSTDITEAYSRLASIETNLLEGVFQLGRELLTRLVRTGFFLGALQHVAEKSDPNEPTHIISVLRDAQKALYVVRNWAMDKTAQFTIDLVLQVHRISMAADRIRVQTDPSTNLATRALLPVGEWRQKMVYVAHRDSATQDVSYTVFHPFDKVPESMEIFVRMAETQLKQAKAGRDCLMPYTLAAWLHHSLISIHPFNDGNGRMTRIISSIPLVMNGLPPICVSAAHKIQYFDALRIADLRLDIGPLAKVLAAESLDALYRVTAIGETHPTDTAYMYD